MKRPKINIELYKEISEHYDNGLSAIKIAKLFNFSPEMIYNVLKKMNVKRRSNKINSRKYEYNENYFKEINTEEKAYWLGFIYADGYITTREGSLQFGLSLASKDINHIEKFKKSINYNGNIYTYKSSRGYSNETSYSRLIISSNLFCENLILQGVVLRKTLILKPPTLVPSLIPHFIRGYIDGDGSICISKTKYGLTYKLRICGTEDILQYIKQYIEENSEVKIKKFQKRHINDSVLNIDIGGNLKALEALNLFYKNASIYLDRKFNRYLDLFNKYRRVD